MPSNIRCSHHNGRRRYEEASKAGHCRGQLDGQPPRCRFCPRCRVHVPLEFAFIPLQDLYHNDTSKHAARFERLLRFRLSKSDFGEVCDAQRPATKQSGKEETEEGESAIHSSIAFLASDRKGAVKSLSDGRD